MTMMMMLMMRLPWLQRATAHWLEHWQWRHWPAWLCRGVITWPGSATA